MLKISRSHDRLIFSMESPCLERPSLYWDRAQSDRTCYLKDSKKKWTVWVNNVHESTESKTVKHDDVIKWKYFPRYWPFVRGFPRSPMNSPHKGQWRGAFMFSLICVWINGWVNNGEAGDLRHYRAHYDVTVIKEPSQIANKLYAFVMDYMHNSSIMDTAFVLIILQSATTYHAHLL